MSFECSSFCFVFSAIKGFKHTKLRPTNVKAPSQVIQEMMESDIIFTAETHNMPTAVAPFSGATTGTGGRIRDVQGVGRGGHTVAGTAGYSVGNLHIPGIIVKQFRDLITKGATLEKLFVIFTDLMNEHFISLLICTLT